MQKALLVSVVLPSACLIQAAIGAYTPNFSAIYRFIKKLLAYSRAKQVPTMAVKSLPQFLCNLLLLSSLLAANTVDAIEAPEHLSSWAFYSSTNTVYEKGVAYSLNHSAFSDHAKKRRIIYLPVSQKANLQGQDSRVGYPIGTVIEKQFYFIRANEPDGFAERRTCVVLSCLVASCRTGASHLERTQFKAYKNNAVNKNNDLVYGDLRL